MHKILNLYVSRYHSLLSLDKKMRAFDRFVLVIKSKTHGAARSARTDKWSPTHDHAFHFVSLGSSCKLNHIHIYTSNCHTSTGRGGQIPTLQEVTIHTVNEGSFEPSSCTCKGPPLLWELRAPPAPHRPPAQLLARTRSACHHRARAGASARPAAAGRCARWPWTTRSRLGRQRRSWRPTLPAERSSRRPIRKCSTCRAQRGKRCENGEKEGSFVTRWRTVRSRGKQLSH